MKRTLLTMLTGLLALTAHAELGDTLAQTTSHMGEPTKANPEVKASPG